MIGFHTSSESSTHYAMQTTVERPNALPVGLADGELDS
jgi:hypothetical protein